MQPAIDVLRKVQRRHVRFAEMATMYLVPRWEDDTKADMWWLPGDQSKFKQDAKELARDLRRCTNLSEYVNQAYDWAREISFETKGEASLVQRLRGLPVHRVREIWIYACEAADCPNSSSLSSFEQSLSTWSSGSHGLRGLERFVSRVANLHMKKAAIAKSRFRFLEREEILDEESIRFLAEKESRTARVFARMMGLADATAAAACYTEFDDDDDEEDSMEEVSVDRSEELFPMETEMNMSIDLLEKSDPRSNIAPLQCIAAGRAA
jgi:hypothetical protein